MATDDKAASPAKRRPGRPRHETPSADFRARQQAIIEQAALVFRRRGFHAGTLEEVADALDMRRASLYHYVGSKEELFYLVVEGGLRAAVGELEQSLAIADTRERFRAVVRHRVDLVARHRNIFAVIFDQRPLVAVDVPEIQSLEARYIELFERAVASALEAGILPEMETRYAVNAIMGLTTWVYKWFRPGVDDPDAFAEACLRMILR